MAFSKFIMVDSGRAVHVNPQYIEQIRDGPEYGTAGLYFNGRSQPIIVHGGVEKALKTLFGTEKMVAVKSQSMARPAAKVISPREAKPSSKALAIATKGT